MARKVPVMYKADDGTEFTTLAGAEFHDKLVEAASEYRRSRTAYEKLLIETKKTADGEPFRMNSYHKYWYIRAFFGFPERVSVQFYSNNFRLNDDDVVEITVWNDSKPERQEYRISDLYHHESESKKALLKAQDECLAELKLRSEVLRSEINGEREGR